MSLRAAKRNARRGINYNLPCPLPGASDETLGEMLQRGAVLLAEENDRRADLGRAELDDEILTIEGPTVHNDIDFGG